MNRLAAIAVLLAAPGLLAAAPAPAQEPYTFSVSAAGGLGGSWDADDDDLGNASFQVGLSMITEPRTRVALRLGQLDLDGAFASRSDAELIYLNVGGEYRFRKGYYDSGLYLALGGYRLEGQRRRGGSGDETSLGLALGVTGEFPVSPRWAVLVELAGHYAEFDEAQFFGIAHAGVAIRF